MGTNTALNYDLVKLKNSFTPLEKDAMSKEINITFFDKEIQRYVRTLSEEIVNEENLVNIYKGFQAVPTHIGKTGYTVRLSGQKGEIHAKSSENYDNVHYILEFSDNLEQLVGKTGKLVVEMKIDL